jgi:hypothetical protein
LAVVEDSSTPAGSYGNDDVTVGDFRRASGRSRCRREAQLDEALALTFPASDPIAVDTVGE